MSKKGSAILVIVICIAVWVAGVLLLYDSYKTGPTILDIDRRTGQIIGPKNFVEAKSGQLGLLTLLCGIAGVAAMLRAAKKQD